MARWRACISSNNHQAQRHGRLGIERPAFRVSSRSDRSPLSTSRRPVGRLRKPAGAIARGEDPAGEKKAAREAARAEREAETDLLEKVVEMFIERHAKRNRRHRERDRTSLELQRPERWRGRRLSTITKPQVHHLLNFIVDRGAPIAANRVHTQLNVMGRWAVERGIVTTNPFAGIKAPSWSAAGRVSAS